MSESAIVHYKHPQDQGGPSCKDAICIILFWHTMIDTDSILNINLSDAITRSFL